MGKLTIVATITAEQDQVSFVKDELIKLITPTRNEIGCLQYDLHQDNDNPAVFLFFEVWQSKELWQDHMNSAHLATYKQTVKDSIVSTKINEMTFVA